VPCVLPWLMGIAINVIRNRFRRLRRDARVRPVSTLTDGKAAAVLAQPGPEPAFEPRTAPPSKRPCPVSRPRRGRRSNNVISRASMGRTWPGPWG